MRAFVCQFDIEASQPGCGDTSKLFLDMWQSSLVLIAQYSLPSLGLILSLYVILELTINVLDRRKPSWRCHHVRISTVSKRVLNWIWIRFVTVSFMWTDMLYLTSCTVLLKALVCVQAAGSYRLDIEKAQLCFTHDHMPVFLMSLLLYLALFLYPLAIYSFLKSSIHRKIEVGAKLEQSAMFSATVFMVQSVRLEWKPIRASYRFLLRNTIALFGVVPAEYSYVLLVVASVSVLDVAFILVKRPYETVVFDTCTHAIPGHLGDPQLRLVALGK
jgi:hypothetical protein